MGLKGRPSLLMLCRRWGRGSPGRRGGGSRKGDHSGRGMGSLCLIGVIEEINLIAVID